MSKQLSKEQIKPFALAGNATITLQSGKTGTHYTYKITKHETNNDLFFIKLLHGPDNTEDYQYIGCYYADTEYFNPCKKWKERPVIAWPPSMRAINYFLRMLNNPPDNIFVYHEGRCGKCGRKLTTPESIERGFGPECIRSI